jgi:heme-degrading monooxygenase HmoA
MHMRLTLLTADPLRVEDTLHFIANEARPRIEDQPGNLGMSLKVKKPLGVVAVETYWISGDAMHASDRNVRATREEAAHRANGTVSVETLQIASMVRTGPWEPGAGVQVTRAESEAASLDGVVAAYEDTTLPWLTETPGFCGALLAAHRRTGQSISETVWEDDDALAASRSVAAAIRVDAVKATSSTVRWLEEYSLVFDSGRQA